MNPPMPRLRIPLAPQPRGTEVPRAAPAPQATVLRTSSAFACLLLLPLLTLLASCRERTPAADLLPGYLEADLVQVASPEGGYLTELAVRRGQQVAADQLLFRLDATPLQLEHDRTAAVRDAMRLRAEDSALGEREENIRRLQALLDAEQARLALAKSEFERHQTLIRGGGVSQAALQEREAAYKQSQENLAALQAQLDLARKGQRPLQIEALKAENQALAAARDLAAWKSEQTARTSPAEAIVHDTLYEPGEYVAPGRPVVVLRRTADLRARFFVPPAQLAQLRLGQEIEILLPGNQPPLRAPVSRISDQAEFTPPVIYSREESERLVFLVEAQLEPGDAAKLHPGLPVSIRIP